MILCKTDLKKKGDYNMGEQRKRSSQVVMDALLGPRFNKKNQIQRNQK